VPIGPSPPLDPVTEKANSLWREFKSQNGDGRVAAFLAALEDAEVMTDDLAFQMFDLLHTNAVTSGDRTNFASCVDALRERRPEVFDEGAHFYLSWRLLHALAESRLEIVPALARELAARAARDTYTFNRTLDALEYHGQLSVLVEALRTAWPRVKPSTDIMARGVSEFAWKGADYEIYNHLEHTASPDRADPVLLERIKFFVEDSTENYPGEFIDDLTGKSGRVWAETDFALRPPRKRSRDDWDDDTEDKQTPDPAAINLSHVISEFLGYLRREEGVPFPRGELVRQELYSYFLRRHHGELDPHPVTVKPIAWGCGVA